MFSQATYGQEHETGGDISVPIVLKSKNIITELKTYSEILSIDFFSFGFSAC